MKEIVTAAGLPHPELAARRAAAAENYPPVVTWRLPDVRRILPVPPGHWLLVPGCRSFPRHPANRWRRCGAACALSSVAPSVTVTSPRSRPVKFLATQELTLERSTTTARKVTAAIRFLAPGPKLDSGDGKPLAISHLPLLREEITTAAAEVKSEARAILPLEQPLALLTNGIGGMARLCVDLGAIKSKYDCLLGANLNPRVPVDRHIFAKRARVWVDADGFISPLDLRSLASFEPGPPAVWHFIANAGNGRTAEIQLTASMPAGRNTTALQFSRPALSLAQPPPLPDHCDVRLTVRIDIEDRNFHWETKRNPGADQHFSSNTRLLTGQPGFAFTPAPDRQLRVFATEGTWHPQPEWSENIPHPVEQSRGQTACGDAYSPGWFDLPMTKGSAVSLIVCADASDPDPVEVQVSQLAPEVQTTNPPKAPPPFASEDFFGRQLLRAVRAYVVRRDDGVTVIAGYPWFLDWGRDSLICARGLLAAGMVEQVKQLLVTFGRFVQNGTLPNTIHGDDASNRDTSDAPLWYGIVCEEAAALVGKGLYDLKVDAGGKTISSVLTEIARGYAAGTPNGIRMDPDSALIWSPSHFTWMDTNFPAGTPREGYPVEIQVLWIRLLRQLARISPEADRARWGELATKAQNSLQKFFWLEDRGWFADQLIAKPGQRAGDAVVDNSLRSNCLFAVSLGLISGTPARRCVSAALRHLVVPGALRTLAPLPVSPPLPITTGQGQLLNNPSEPYWGRYEGDEDTRRKPAYHNGTAWTWTFPVFCEALARAWDSSPAALAAARAYLGSMDHLLMQSCVGQIPEILDGDAPHLQRGCDAQAWGVTEALRVLVTSSTRRSKMSLCTPSFGINCKKRELTRMALS